MSSIYGEPVNDPLGVARRTSRFMLGRRESLFTQRDTEFSKPGSVMELVLPCGIWNSVSMPSFHEASLTGQRCYARTRIFHPVMANEGKCQVTFPEMV
jgi:hypothetical protein